MTTQNNLDHAQRLSNYQYSLLREAERTGGLTLDRMLEISQTTAGSVVRRGFFKWNDSVERFQVTPDGQAVMKLFGGTDIGRTGWDRPLSSFILKEKWGRGLDQATEGLRATYREAIRKERGRESGVDRAKIARVKRNQNGPQRKGQGRSQNSQNQGAGQSGQKENAA